MKELNPDCALADAANEIPPTSDTEPLGAKLETVVRTLFIEKDGSTSGIIVARVPANEPYDRTIAGEEIFKSPRRLTEDWIGPKLI